MSAIQYLMQQSVTDPLTAIAEGIGHIVENLRRLEKAARVLHDAECGQPSRIIEGFAKEEAAKVLILIDVVRCPPSRHKELRRTVGYFDKHLAKRIYAEACSWRPASFEELKGRTEIATRSHYLDGPKGVDWIFPNDVKARRERDIYVDYIKDLTEEDGEHMWMTPFADSMAKWPYVEPRAIATVEALYRLGTGSEDGVNVIREEWQDYDPELSSNSDDHRARIVRTLKRLSRDNDGPEVHDAVTVIVENWPFPMWSLDLSKESKVDLAELRQSRRDLIAQFEQVASVREPELNVTAGLIDELASAYEAAEKDRDRLEDEQARSEEAEREREGTRSRSKLRIRRISVVESPLFVALKERLQQLTEEERADLVALAWFTRDPVANWARVRGRAAEMIQGMDYTYQVGLGNAWREGYGRWKSASEKFEAGALQM